MNPLYLRDFVSLVMLLIAGLLALAAGACLYSGFCAWNLAQLLCGTVALFTAFKMFYRLLR